MRWNGLEGLSENPGGDRLEGQAFLKYREGRLIYLYLVTTQTYETCDGTNLID